MNQAHLKNRIIIVLILLDTTLQLKLKNSKNSSLKIFAFLCSSDSKKKGQIPNKLPVTNRGRQPDGRTYCYGPDLFFKKEQGQVNRIDQKDSGYVWIQDSLPKVKPFKIYNGTERADLLDLIHQKFSKENTMDKLTEVILILGTVDEF